MKKSLRGLSLPLPFVLFSALTRCSMCWDRQEDTDMRVHTTTSNSLASATKSTADDVWDVVIVGAGQAGMAAAHRLIYEQQQDTPSRQHHLRVLVLEASDHVGGRTRNFDVATGKTDVVSDDVIEMGGTWLSPAHTASLRLCQHHLGLDVFPSSFLPYDTVLSKGSDDNTTTTDNGEDCLDEPDFPWWFLGPDYSEEEMLRLKRIIVHQCTGVDNRRIKTIAVSNPKDFLRGFSTQALEQLTAVGKIIENDATALVDFPHRDDNAWEVPTVGKRWHEFDSDSTAREKNFLTSKDSITSPHLTDVNARNVLRGVVHNKNAEDPEKVSYLYNLISWRGSNSAGPDMEYRLRGGTQAIPLTIFKKLEESAHGHEVTIELNNPVNSVGRITFPDNDDSMLRITTGTGCTYQSKTVLMTGSPASLRKIDFGAGSSAVLPKVQTDLLSAENSPMGRCIKFCAIYKIGPWWRKFNLQGDIMSSGLPEELSVGTHAWNNNETKESVPLFSYCFDVSPFSQKFGVLCCFVEGVAYEEFHRMTMELKKEKMRLFLRLSFANYINETAAVVGQEVAGRPLWEPDDFACFDWGPETSHVGGAYTSYFPPRVLTHLDNWEGYKTIEKARNVFWAGADYHAGFGNGYIEGAIRGGQVAADKILERISSPTLRTSDK